ncbi:MAG: response regulator, partial [Bdellovibrionales bacterium]|nr:response regulator [Bdellovibrionales bacterium]
MPENAIERRYKILVADDDPDTRAIVSSVVGLLPCEIEEAVDGIDALQKFEKFQPDLAILDIMMPGLNGNQVCQKIKHSQHGGLVPVLMLTARDSVQDKVDSFEIGADDYQTKPFNYQELQARVKALLRVRDLNIKLHAKNLELQAASEKLVEQERQLVVMQLAGTAAHQLGQPLSAILLNCHL